MTCRVLRRSKSPGHHRVIATDMLTVPAKVPCVGLQNNCPLLEIQCRDGSAQCVNTCRTAVDQHDANRRKAQSNNESGNPGASSEVDDEACTSGKCIDESFGVLNDFGNRAITEGSRRLGGCQNIVQGAGSPFPRHLVGGFDDDPPLGVLTLRARGHAVDIHQCVVHDLSIC